LLQLNVNQSLEPNNISLFNFPKITMIADSQVYTALCIALLASILAVRLGSTLNE
jgi:photosystem I reaction center subunit XII